MARLINGLNAPIWLRAGRAGAALTLIGALALTGFGPAPVLAHDPDARLTVDAFLIGLGCVESGGRYDITNPRSGAYGKYQIMPANWPHWARRYLGDSGAKQTPRNQELVARAKVKGLHAWRGQWRRVAYWWLTGGVETDSDKWSTSSRNYVSAVISIASRAMTAQGRAQIPAGCLSEPGTAGGSNGQGDSRTTTGHVNVRVAPGFESRRVGVVLRGTSVSVLAKGTDRRGKTWFMIRRSGGRTGWIAGWFTR